MLAIRFRFLSALLLFARRPSSLAAAASNGLAQTPVLGWRNWNQYQ